MLTKEEWAERFPDLDYPTRKQWLFCESYLSGGFNATNAAIEAGYKAVKNVTMRQIASENLKKPNLRAFIEYRLTTEVMPSDEVLARLSTMARGFDVADYVKVSEIYGFNNEGQQYLTGYALSIDFDKLQEDGYSHLVKKVKSTKAGIEVEWHDQMAALVHIGKKYGLFTEKLDVTSGGEKLDIIGIEIISPEDSE